MPGYSQLVRVQLAETLHPGSKAQVNYLVIDRTTAHGREPAQDRFKVNALPYEPLYIHDPRACNFGGQGEWIDCRWRSDLSLFEPVGSHGLTQRGYVEDATILTSASTGMFRIARKKPDDTFDTSIQVEVSLEWGRLPPVLPIGTEVILRWVPDHWSNDNSLGQDTGEWIIVNIIGISAIIGKLNASGATAMAAETGCAGKGTVELYELNPQDECLDALGVSTTVYNMCAALSGDQWIQAKDIGGNYWFDVVCCP